MTTKRIFRLNSLLKEVISEVVRKDVNNPKVSTFVTITGVDISKDLHYAKVYVSVIGTEVEKRETLAALQSAAGYIGMLASKEVVIRHFPTLSFKLDDGVDKHMRIDDILKKIHQEEKQRQQDTPTAND